MPAWPDGSDATTATISIIPANDRIGNTSNRLIVDIEQGKPTVQLQKVLDLRGLELVVCQKTARPL